MGTQQVINDYNYTSAQRGRGVFILKYKKTYKRIKGRKTVFLEIKSGFML